MPAMGFCWLLCPLLVARGSRFTKLSPEQQRVWPYGYGTKRDVSSCPLAPPPLETQEGEDIRVWKWEWAKLRATAAWFSELVLQAAECRSLSRCLAAQLYWE
ncbi:sister chromatid cohesion protein PDS5-like protein A [Platysternon megacephalum]|uniref:Sister chromatid cohesion protein PDS5-like protein A n=1 Tax=Platysternon megacephalum TaxID=55544 RepID=A0A4D9EWT5_9SAUR|nr:sister chromatid cohesion protein PDS5-like protein A [Platysternon megacephalum]